MGLRDIAVGERLDVARGDVVVCVPLRTGRDEFARCFRALVAHTATSIPILIADDLPGEEGRRDWIDDLLASGGVGHDVLWLGRSGTGTDGETATVALATAAPADVAVVDRAIVGAGWLDGLRDSAYVDDTIATATPLLPDGAQAPKRPPSMGFDDAVARVREGAARTRPRITAAGRRCVYIRRGALELAGDFGADFSDRCLALGLQHVLADEVFVERAAVNGEAEPHTVDPESPLARSLAIARRSLRGALVTIDGRSLGPVLMGTQLHTLELIAAVHAASKGRVRVLLPVRVGDYARPVLDQLHGIETITEHDVTGASRDDVVHRPWQVTAPGDLALLAHLGERLVVTHQDLIAYRNPSYFSSPEAWQAFRELTAEAMGIASMVLFFSRHACEDALAEELVPRKRARVIHIGTDHRIAAARPSARRPSMKRGRAETPFLLCIGADYRHKNRLFALRVFEALSERHGWPGRIVFAGPRLAHGTSTDDELAYFDSRPDIAGRTDDLGVVDEAQKAWLLEHCTAVLYPTTYEGFGLVPFEAAEYGRPCLFAAVSSLCDLLPSEAATLVPWDVAESAQRVMSILGDPAASEALVGTVRSAAAGYTWERTGHAVVAAYDDAIGMPARPAARIRGSHLTIDARYWALRDQIGGAGMALVKPEGPLLTDKAQRALAALAARRATRRLVIGALELAHRLIHPVIGSRRGEEDGPDLLIEV